MSLMDRLVKRKVKKSTEAKDFIKKLQSLHINDDKKIIYERFLPDIDIGQLIKDRYDYLIPRWTSHHKKSWVDERYMSSCIDPQLKRGFYDIWTILRLFMDDDRGLDRDCLIIIQQDIRGIWNEFK